MSTQAFVLIETGAGMTKDAVMNLYGVAGVKFIDAITGPYDLIAMVEATSFHELRWIVENAIGQAPGVARAVACLRIKNDLYEKAA